MSQNIFEDRFSFISNTVLRKHLGDALEFTVHLVSLTLHKPQRQIIIDGLNKTILLYTASIVEAVIHDFIKTQFCKKTFYEKNWTYFDINMLYKIKGDEKDNQEIIAGKRRKKKLKIKRNIDFKTLNEICYRQKVLTEKQFKKVEGLRKERNKIHLAGLSGQNIPCTKKEIDDFSKTASVILSKIESLCRNS